MVRRPRARRPAIPPRRSRRIATRPPPSAIGAAGSRSPFVGLTGGIGAGKSTALATLERLGAAVLSTDRVVHDLYDSDEMRDEVVARWGDDVAPGGTVDRTAVATRVFGSEDDRRWLEALLWPRVGERVAEWRAEVMRREPPPRALVVEVPLLFEAGMEEGFDATVAVVAPEDVRARRAADRGHASLDERGTRQLTQTEKAQRATYTVCNDASKADLESRLSAILENLTCRDR